ncbi:tyrosine-type recombinase/integrase [Algoriphagus limi]|uniref:Site-specific integrase n=1 Tax=Algoriphagus limi TaxID=2975273 RepID=A0ABT2G286_9BACT|nr:site-specific integrase [Algoriphagus limi]MCS5488918.1 site-specific integrase [Algoriphagus limi]
MRPQINIFLDTRRKKKNGLFPVKLRVYNPITQKKKLYPTVFDLSEKDFQSAWESKRTREEFRAIRKKLVALEDKATEISESLFPFTFDAFEEKLYSKPKVDHRNVFAIFDQVEAEKLESGAISTAEKYRLAKVSIQNFLKFKNQKFDRLSFDKVTVHFLKSYQNYSENIKGLSAATIGIYLRNLRAVYRLGIKLGIANQEMYPFASDSFKIPTSKKINKALNEEQLKQLWNFQPITEDQARAKDFWFFSYFSYGMNTRDICELKHSSLDNDSFQYIRAKTKNTKKERSIKQVPLNESLKQIIERRRNPNSPYLFGIISEKDSPVQRHEKIRNFNKVINHHFRAFAKSAGIEEHLANQIGTYHARHSFATVSIRKGIPLAMISEILHDGNLKVTQNYINSFPKEAFKELSQNLEFDKK